MAFNLNSMYQGNNNSYEGVKKMSKSQVIPRNLADFETFFRQSSSREEGWLLVKVGNQQNWSHKWVLFDDCVLYLSDSDLSTRAERLTISMDKVISIRTDDSVDRASIQLVTADEKLFMKAEGIDEMNKWIFCFQKSVALLLSKLLGAQARSSAAATSLHSQDQIAGSVSTKSLAGSTEESRRWLRELGHGHDRHSLMLNKRRSFRDRALQQAPAGPSLGSSVSPPGVTDTEERSRFHSMSSADRSSNGSSHWNAKGSRESTTSGAHGPSAGITLGTALLPPSGLSQSLSARPTVFPLLDRSPVQQRPGGSVPPPPSAAIPIHRPSEPSPASSSLEQKLATSYNDRRNSKNILADAGVEMRLRLMSAESARIEQEMEDELGDGDEEGIFHWTGGSEPADSRDGLCQDPLSSHYDSMMMFDLEDGPSSLAQHSPTRSAARSPEALSKLSSAPPVGSPLMVAHRTSSNGSSYQNMGSSSSSSSSSFKSNTSIAIATDFSVSEAVPTRAPSRPLSVRGRGEPPSFVAAALDVLNGSNNAPASSHTQTTSTTASISALSTLSGPHPIQPPFVPPSPTPGGRVFTSGLAASLSGSPLPGPRVCTWSSGHCSLQGPRNCNEDRLVALPVYAPTDSAASASLPQAYFAVYDGHCGEGASTYLQQHLHRDLERHPLFSTDLTSAIIETAVAADRAFLALCEQEKLNAGTTALGAVLRGCDLTVFNIGDCHAVLCTRGQPRDLSVPHKPGRVDERDRILRAGGWVTEEKELYMARLHLMDMSDPLVRRLAEKINFVTIHRVCADLAVSRSIGDPDYKRVVPGARVTHWFPWPEDHSQSFAADLVIPNPELITMRLAPGDDFMVIASDGLWDVMSSADAVVVVREGLAAGHSPSQIAEDLSELALRLGSTDNVSVIVVVFSYAE